jgi:hypothetical protein
VVTVSLTSTLHVANRSQLPIYDVQIATAYDTYRLDEMPAGAVAAGELRRELERHVVAPGMTWTSENALEYSYENPVMTFTDARGRRWRRDHDQKLHREQSGWTRGRLT